MRRTDRPAVPRHRSPCRRAPRRRRAPAARRSTPPPAVTKVKCVRSAPTTAWPSAARACGWGHRARRPSWRSASSARRSRATRSPPSPSRPARDKRHRARPQGRGHRPAGRAGRRWASLRPVARLEILAAKAPEADRRPDRHARHRPQGLRRRRAPADAQLPPADRAAGRRHGRRRQPGHQHRGRDASTRAPCSPAPPAPSPGKTLRAAEGRYAFVVSADGADGAERVDRPVGRRRRLRAPRPQVPDPRQAHLRRAARAASAPAAPATRTRARTSSPSAARRWSPPAAAR